MARRADPERIHQACRAATRNGLAGKHLFEDFTKSLDLVNWGVRQSRWATSMEFAVRH